MTTIHICPDHAIRRDFGILVSILGSLLLAGLDSSVSLAQVATAITADSTLKTVVTPNGAIYEITGGTRPSGGPNLFHSFGEFSIATGDTALYRNTTPELLTANLLSRVTGGNPSQIFGTIDTLEYPGANFFLINPAGIVFGPTAFLNVGGSVAFATADYLRLADETRFTAIPGPQDMLLSSAPVAAFGFLEPTPAGITVDGTQLFVLDGNSFSLVGGDIQIDGGGFGGGVAAFNGLLQVVSVRSAGEAVFNSAELSVDSFSRLGTITLSNNAVLDASDFAGSGAGTVRIRGGRLVLDGSSISADTFGDVDGAPVGIDIRLAEDAEVRNLSTIQSTTQGGLGRAGDVKFTAGSLLLDNSGLASSSVGVEGGSGDVFVEVDQLTIANGGSILSNSFGPGQAGKITITATGPVLVTGANEVNPSRIASSTQSPTKDAGTISISAPSLELSDGGAVLATTEGAGRGGDIIIEKGDILTVRGGQIKTTSTPFFPGESGPAGDITITTNDRVVISGQGAGLFSTTGGSGLGGDITVTAGQSVTLQNGSSITATSTGVGNAGNIFINAGQNYTSTNSSVTTQASQASGGDITVLATDMVRLTNSQINASVQGSQTTIGGNIVIDPQFVILQNSQILAQAFEGQGGNITIVAGVFFADPTSTVSASSTLGVSGTVDIQAPVTNLSGTLAPLPAEIVQAAGLLQARCAARLAGGTSGSFVVAGRDGLPLEPGGMLPSPLYAESPGSGRLAGSLDVPGLRVGRTFVESNLTLVPLAIGCSS